jgi:hypothetical protein
MIGGYTLLVANINAITDENTSANGGRKSTDALDREWRKGETVINRQFAAGAPIGETRP